VVLADHASQPVIENGRAKECALKKNCPCPWEGDEDD